MNKSNFFALFYLENKMVTKKKDINDFLETFGKQSYGILVYSDRRWKLVTLDELYQLKELRGLG